jgi:hypothetical protein
MSNTNEPRAGPKSAGGAFDRKLTELSAGAQQQPDKRPGKQGQQQPGGQRGGGSKGGAQSPRGRSAEEEGQEEQRWAAPSSDRPVLPASSSEVAVFLGKPERFPKPASRQLHSSISFT